MNELRTCLDVLTELHEVDPQMTVSSAIAFLYVAEHQPCQMRDIAMRLKLAQSTTSRMIADLTELDRNRQPGLDLIESKPWPQERRRRILALTAKGEWLRKKILYSIQSH